MALWWQLSVIVIKNKSSCKIVSRLLRQAFTVVITVFHLLPLKKKKEKRHYFE